MSSPHARQLREGVEAWLRAAAEQPGRVALYWRFPFPNGREHTVIECASTYRVLAVFTTVSKLAVSEEEWAELWGPEGPIEES